MYFEVSARTGQNITNCFNQLAKKLTGIETNPINQSELKNTGFTLNNVGGANNGGADTKTNDKTKGKKKKCGC